VPRNTRTPKPRPTLRSQIPRSKSLNQIPPSRPVASSLQERSAGVSLMTGPMSSALAPSLEHAGPTLRSQPPLMDSHALPEAAPESRPHAGVRSSSPPMSASARPFVNPANTENEGRDAAS